MSQLAGVTAIGLNLIAILLGIRLGGVTMHTAPCSTR